jgi:hypothetical protein
MGGPLTSLRELPLSRATQPLNVEGYRQVRSTFVQPDLIGKSTVWVTSHRIASPSIPILIPIPYNTYIPLRCPSTPPSRSPRSHLTSPRLPHSPLLLTALYKHCSSPTFTASLSLSCHQHTVHLNRQRLQHVESYTSRHQAHPRGAKYQLQFERSTSISSSGFESSHQCLLTPQNL